MCIRDRCSISKENDDSISWIVDSGATDHLVSAEKYFTDVSNLKEPIKIYVAMKSQNIC